MQQKVRALRAGADDYLIKPFHPAELLARMKSLLARFAPSDSLVGRPPMGRIHAYYGAKGGVGHDDDRDQRGDRAPGASAGASCLVDGNLQFGDHRVFLDLGLDRKSIVDVVSAPAMDARPHPQVDRPDPRLGRSTCCSRRRRPRPPTSSRPGTCTRSSSCCAGMYDYVIVDIDKRLDDLNLMVLDVAETIFVVMTADLSCLKNVRLVLETIGHLGYERSKLKLVLNRSNAFTGINVKSAEGALRRPIEHQIVNEYRGAISALNSGAPFMARQGGLGARAVGARLRAGGRPGRRRAGRAARAGRGAVGPRSLAGRPPITRHAISRG